MTFKSKLIAAVALVASLGAGAASAVDADAYFGVQSNLERSQGEVTINYVVAPADGTIELYDYTGSVQGQLLGSAEVTAGGNINTSIDFPNISNDKVLAVLTVDGQPLASEVLLVKSSS